MILNVIKYTTNFHWPHMDFQIRRSELSSRILPKPEDLLKDGDIKCHKKFYLPSLDSIWCSNEMAKGFVLGCCIYRMDKANTIINLVCIKRKVIHAVWETDYKLQC